MTTNTQDIIISSEEIARAAVKIMRASDDAGEYSLEQFEAATYRWLKDVIFDLLADVDDYALARRTGDFQAELFKEARAK